ncbi:MAG TPA: FMN-binding negative transcriptional regulator [Gemmatimonadaceae bacterium]|nr:FMN-binding negative transcriptional regulator [Gemmatimonadaceae bacterium]
MYTPPSFAEADLATLHAYVEAHPFATLVTATDGEPFATHLPLVLDRSRGPFGALLGHLARANPHARQLLTGRAHRGLAIFSGPDAYVTPGWYPTKAEHGRVVPTWNYVAVHAAGVVTPHDDPEFLRPHLEALTARHERDRGGSWRVTDAPEEFLAQQMRAIVGIEIAIERLDGKWKMSQNRSDADIRGVIDGLSASPSPSDHVVAGLVAARRPTNR